MNFTRKRQIERTLSAMEGEDYVARLDEAVASQVEGGKATQPAKVQGANLSSYKEWMMDSARKAGDATATADSTGSGYYVVVFLSRDNNDYNMAQVRHILVKAVADENGEYTDEAKAEALAKAEDILAEFEAGDKTEESFAALAEEHSEDTGSNTNGGLYDSVTKGQMVEEFNDWIFADNRQAGDVGIVETDYGCHLMYFVGDGEYSYRDTLVVNALRFKEHPSHFNVAEALALIRRVAPRVAYLTHMSHEIGRYAETEPTLPAGVHLAWDGLCVEIGGKESESTTEKQQ